MTRSLAPRTHTKTRKRIPPDPNAVHHRCCQRCNRLFWARGIADECFNCIDHALRTFELGPIQGESSGT